MIMPHFTSQTVSIFSQLSGDWLLLAEVEEDPWLPDTRTLSPHSMMDAETVTIVISIQESNLIMNASAKLWCVVLVSVSTPPRLMPGCYNGDSKYGIALQTANTGEGNLQKVIRRFLWRPKYKIAMSFSSFSSVQNRPLWQDLVPKYDPVLVRPERPFSITITLVLIHTTVCTGSLLRL